MQDKVGSSHRLLMYIELLQLESDIPESVAGRELEPEGAVGLADPP